MTAFGAPIGAEANKGGLYRRSNQLLASSSL
jgi:hypothetical protein